MNDYLKTTLIFVGVLGIVALVYLFPQVAILALCVLFLVALWFFIFVGVTEIF